MSEGEKIIYKKTYARYLKLFTMDEKKDITFIFEDSDVRIKAHKLILEIVSPVFETMFNGLFEEKDTATIRDITPEVFQKLIDVIYMQPGVVVNSLEEAVELCNVAEMYDVEDLKDLASDFMDANCSFKNAFYLYEKAKLFNLDNLQSKCLSLFRDANFINDNKILEALIQDLDFINEDSFAKFLSVNSSPESALYQILEYFVKTGILKTYQKAIGQIRFLSMSIEEVVLAELLSESERLTIIANIEANKEQTEPSLDMPEHLSSFIIHRTSVDSFNYKYFWITMLLKCPVEGFEIVFKRVATMKALFTVEQIQIMKDAFQHKLNGEEMAETNDYYVVRKILKDSGLLKWYDIIFHANKHVTIFGKDLADEFVSLEFILEKKDFQSLRVSEVLNE